VIAAGCVLASFYLSIDGKPHANTPLGTSDPAYKAAMNSWAQGLLGAWFPWFLATTLYFGYKFTKGTKIVNPADADLMTGRWVPPPRMAEEESKPLPMWKRILSKFT